MEAVTACKPCQIAADLAPSGRLHRVAPGWTLNANVGTLARPNLVLQTVDHVADIASLSAQDSHDLGRLLPAAVHVLRTATGAVKVYVEYLNEVHPPHVHIHLVPRFEDDVARAGDVLDSPASPEAWSGDADEIARIVSDTIALDVTKDPSALVRIVNRALDAWKRWCSVYSLLRHVTDNAPALAELYVPAWLAALAVLAWLVSSASGNVQDVFVAIAAYRFVDIVVYQLSILLSREAGPLHSFRRSFVLLTLNIAEVVAAGAVVIRWRTPASWGQAMVDAFDLLTLRGPRAAGDAFLEATYLAAAMSSLLLVAVGLSTVVGLISQGFHEAPHDRRTS